MASETYYDFSSVTTLADGDIIPVAPATPGKYLKIAWSTLKRLVVNLVWPVSSWYTQYPAAASNDPAVAFPSSESPASLFGGTWELMYSTEGVVFQSEGYDGAGRTDGLMEDQMQGHYHNQAYNINTGGAGATNAIVPIAYGNGVVSQFVLPPKTDGTNGDPRTGTRTAHRNRLMRVYRRTA